MQGAIQVLGFTLLYRGLQAFAVFCGMGISNTRMYEQVVKAMARQSIAIDILAYHTSASVEEVQRLKVRSHHRGSTGPVEYFPEQLTSQYGRQ